MKGSVCCLFFALLGLISTGASAGELVVVVSAKNPVDALNRDQVINIFMGRFRHFSTGLKAEPIDQHVGSIEKERFYRYLVGKDVSEISAYWARLVFSGRTQPPIQAESAAEQLQLLASKNGGITYLDRSQVDSRFKIVFSLGPL